jgi:hypothetical protein
MRARLGSLLVLVGSCGPAVSVDATGTTGHTSAVTSSTAGPSSTDAVTSTTSTAATSTAGESGEATTTAGETGEASVTAASTDTTATGTTSEESSTGEPSGVVYTAEYYIGQINRITVYRADFDADNCAFIKLAEDGSEPDMSVTLPPFWEVERTQVSQGASGCLGGEPGTWEEADSVMGVADFDLSMACTIDIDMTATFLQTEPWVPLEIHFMASDVPIEGIC